MIIELDKYTIKARLYPSFIVLLPALVLSLYYITDFEKYYHYLTAIAAGGLFTYLLSQLGRDKGKIKEPSLFNYWGGKPTTQILRHSNEYLDNVTKTRYHTLLTQKIPGVQIPSSNQEQNDPISADQVYESCARFLISKTRDIKKFELLFKENISFGFRRNLWGMKTWALILLFLCFVVHSYFATSHYTIFNQFEERDVSLFLFIFITVLFWIVVVTKNWIKIPAFAYAERLYEALNGIP